MPPDLFPPTRTLGLEQLTNQVANPSPNILSHDIDDFSEDATTDHTAAEDPIGADGGEISADRMHQEAGGAEPDDEQQPVQQLDAHQPAPDVTDATNNDAVTPPDTSSAPSVDQMQIRPHTRLQSGVCKEKVYTDGTIKYKHS